MSVSAMPASPTSLAEQYRQIRGFTERIIDPLSPEDCMVQSMDDVSPTRWHIAHTTWFFETFILGTQPGYKVFDDQFRYLFNSYYNTIGDQFPRPQRGFISRPGLEQIKAYRHHVDQRMVELLESESLSDELNQAFEIGLHHEQQHQELMLTDIKHVLSCNPTLPEYQDLPFADSSSVQPEWLEIQEGVYEVGHVGSGFAFDNESPRHKTFLHNGALQSRRVTCGEYIEFIEQKGYEQPQHWLAMGWATVQEHGWKAPLYWVKQNDQWMQFTLAGLIPVNPNWPVCHVSYFEADAFARWAGHRLPTESEWEVAHEQTASNGDSPGQFADALMESNHAIHPTISGGSMLGGVWEWTSSSYSAYPGYAPPSGALGEYNGKFMCNQYVLRGGSVATSHNHIRPTYRNFFGPSCRWQFMGFRLAK